MSTTRLLAHYGKSWGKICLCIFSNMCCTFSIFLRSSLTFSLNVYPRIVYTKLLTSQLISLSKFSLSLLFVTVLGSYGTTIDVTSEVSSCKYTCTYIINLTDWNTGIRLSVHVVTECNMIPNTKCLQLLLGVLNQVWKSFYESVIIGRIWLTC